jgi:hypothetical protein
VVQFLYHTRKYLIDVTHLHILLSHEASPIVTHSSLGAPSTPRAQEGPQSDTRDLSHAWKGDPNGPSIGHVILGMEEATYS